MEVYINNNMCLLQSTYVLCISFECIVHLALTTDPTGKILYADIHASQVMGWPPSVRFCHPNNLSKSELTKVSSAMKEIKFKLGLY